jgi:hypothetical protein
MVWLSKALVNARIIYFNSRWETQSLSVGLGTLSLFVCVFGPVIVSAKQKHRQQINIIKVQLLSGVVVEHKL